jgi:hypothetical protein
MTGTAANTGIGPVLYSTNAFLKCLIQEKYRGDVHHVWCSEHFAVPTGPAYKSSLQVPPSSTPADIFRRLKDDVTRGDTHSAKIAEQRAGFIARAIQWEAAGEITSDQKDEIVYYANLPVGPLWRPIVYVIPSAPLLSRLTLVPASSRAGFGDEYVISDLARAEFDIIEF